MTTKQIQQALRDLGFLQVGPADGKMGTNTHRAVEDFQRAYSFEDLTIDGWPGPKTQAALTNCLGNGHHLSPHFTSHEFIKPGWEFEGLRLHRQLLRGLEAYRAMIGGPVAIVSGYRGPQHNKKVGGASNSQHLYGNAADVPGARPFEPVHMLRAFAGIGIRKSDGRVLHVDVRQVGPNTTGTSVSNPAKWYYA